MSTIAMLALALGTLTAAGQAGAPPRAAAVSGAPAAAPDPRPLRATDAAALERQWGISIESLRLTAADYMLDFRYRVLDAAKAAPLFDRRIKPRLRDETSGVVVAVLTPPKVGALRSSNPPQEGRRYFTFFANPGRMIKRHDVMTVTIGEFSVSGLIVR